MLAISKSAENSLRDIQDGKKITRRGAAGTHDLKEAAEPCPLFDTAGTVYSYA
jgi:hypothetical protein